MTEDDRIEQLKGTVIADAYRLGRPFARGGFAVLYSATRIADELPVAVKLLDVRAALREDPQARERFDREISCLKRLGHHPNVVKTYDAGLTDEGHVYLVMERLFGTTLTREIAGAPLTLSPTARLLRQLLSALEHIHAGHLVHRDIKPSNLLLVDTHRVGRRDGLKLIDFGFVKQLGLSRPAQTAWKRPITGVSARLGTPGYMAPEMLREGIVTPQVDLYAAGIVTHEMLTGRPAFPGKGVERARAALDGQIQAAPDIVAQSPLYGVVQRLFAEPKRRFKSASEALDALRPVLVALELDETSTHAPPSAPPGPPPAPPGRDDPGSF